LVKLSIERAENLIKGVWNTCFVVLDEWSIGEIKESLEYLMPKTEVVEQVRASSEDEIRDFAVLDSETMHFSVMSPTKTDHLGRRQCLDLQERYKVNHLPNH
jgi:hypothetical protein